MESKTKWDMSHGLCPCCQLISCLTLHVPLEVVKAACRMKFSCQTQSLLLFVCECACALPCMWDCLLINKAMYHHISSLLRSGSALNIKRDTISNSFSLTIHSYPLKPPYPFVRFCAPCCCLQREFLPCSTQTCCVCVGTWNSIFGEHPDCIFGKLHPIHPL